MHRTGWLMSDRNVAARLDLLTSEAGGLATTMPPRTPSLLLVFDSLDPDRGEDVQLGAVIDAPDGLQPGVETDALLRFWSEIGRVHATPGAVFRLWYAGRIVGTGVVLEEQCEPPPACI